jgi:hypothetical protein
MGYGEVVGNESVHWAVVYEDNAGTETGSARGRDPKKFTDIGTRPPKRRLAAGKTAPAKTFLPKPNFRVRLMYPTKEQALRAKESAEIVEIEGRFFLMINTPAVRRKKEQVDPPTPPAEVRVDW